MRGRLPIFASPLPVNVEHGEGWPTGHNIIIDFSTFRPRWFLRIHRYRGNCCVAVPLPRGASWCPILYVDCLNSYKYYMIHPPPDTHAYTFRSPPNQLSTTVYPTTLSPFYKRQHHRKLTSHWCRLSPHLSPILDMIRYCIDVCCYPTTNRNERHQSMINQQE